MVTVGLIIAAGFLAQTGEGLSTDYSKYVGSYVEFVLPPGVSLPQGWAEPRRSGRLDAATARPRNPGEFTLQVAWDEPWAPSRPESLNDTVRDASGRMQKLVLVPESEADRLERIQRGWTERNYTLIGNDPLVPQSWVPVEEVKLAERAQEMARANAIPAAEVEATVSAPAPETSVPAPPAPGFLAGRVPQILLGVVGIALAGVIVKILVF